MQVECHNQRERHKLRYHGFLDLPNIPFEPVGEVHIRQLHAGQ